MDIGATASSIFGSTSADTIFSAGVSGAATPAQQSARITIDANEREINRIRGYKLQLTPADKLKLTEIQGEIRAIEIKASDGTVRADELEDRKQLFLDADRIIGKPIIDIETDFVLASLSESIDTLLAPRLDRATANRVAFLERIKTNLEAKITADPDRRAPQVQLQSISRVINGLTPARSITQLSQVELKAYDKLVELVNNHAGVKIELTSKEAIRVSQLQRSIVNMQASLPPDTSQQPTSQDVARAYARLG